MVAKTKVGEEIIFGRYEQDDNPANGQEEIAWCVLAVEDGKALLISEKCLDGQPYQAGKETVTWENCTLRAWLNNDFFNSAFTDEEQNNIILSQISNSDDKQSGNNNKKNGITEDGIFILSITEAEKYFYDDGDRKAEVTGYAQAKYVYRVADMGWWWLRSTGIKNAKAAYVISNGYINCDGYDASNTNIAVRPAMWISI